MLPCSRVIPGITFETMAQRKKFKNRALEFFEDERGFYYLRTAEGEDLTEEDVAGLSNWISIETAAERKPLLIELSYGSTISPGVQAFFAESINRYSTADAILISTFAHKLMSTFYLRHHKPKLPTRVFNDVFEALAWLDSQRTSHT
jgi:hypothetical protein